MSDATRILQAVEQGEPHAAEQLLPLVYDESAPEGRASETAILRGTDHGSGGQGA